MNITAKFPCLSGGGGGGHGVALHHLDGPRSVQFLDPAIAAHAPNKRKRRPAGTPDPDAEVVALSPKTLMESDRYVCEICNQGFQRDQNLQMHRRRHKVPWKLLKRPTLTTTKRVYICPERACLHHDPAHALGDLVGIKKHYRRKHCTEKQWKCDRCSKSYAVQSDYKAHLKTCGTRGHCCDCGRVFSRVESFIEHQDTCSAVKRKNLQSEGESERSTPRLATDTANSTESPSQSSDTTQAMSFTQSGMSDTVARSVYSANAAKLLLDEHARRIQADSPHAATSSAAAMPAWLHTDSGRQELELLHRRLPSMPTDHQPQSDDRFEVRLPRAHASRSQAVTRCSSTFATYPSSEVRSGPMIFEPSLQLSIGPTSPVLGTSSASPSSYTDIKPSLSNSTVQERETLASSAYHDVKQKSVGFDALARLVPATVGQYCGGNNVNPRMEGGSDAMNSFTGFLTALKPVESSAGLDQSKHESNIKPNRTSEMVSTYHENWAGNVHESDPAPIQRGFTSSEPATSSVISNKEAPVHLDVADTERHFFGVKFESTAFRPQKQMAAQDRFIASCAQTLDLTRPAWTSHTARDEAVRRECNETHRELARAEILKREAREQLQFAAAEKAYADRAREAAKRQVEISEAELSKAKRLRAQAQAELETANSHAQAALSPPLCHSCKSVIQDRPPTPTSLNSWPMMTPSRPEAPATTHSFFINPAKTMSWTSESMTGDQLWPGSHASMRSGFPSGSLAVGASAPSGAGNPNLLVAVQVSSPDDRPDQTIAANDLDLN